MNSEEIIKVFDQLKAGNGYQEYLIAYEYIKAQYEKQIKTNNNFDIQLEMAILKSEIPSDKNSEKIGAIISTFLTIYGVCLTAIADVLKQNTE